MFALVNFHMEYSKTEGNPCSLDHLVNSHFILLKLVNDANDNLGILVGSYFGSQVRPIMSNIHWPQGIIYGIIYHKVKEYSFFIDLLHCIRFTAGFSENIRFSESSDGTAVDSCQILNGNKAMI